MNLQNNISSDYNDKKLPGRNTCILENKLNKISAIKVNIDVSEKSSKQTPKKNRKSVKKKVKKSPISIKSPKSETEFNLSTKI